MTRILSLSWILQKIGVSRQKLARDRPTAWALQTDTEQPHNTVLQLTVTACLANHRARQPQVTSHRNQPPASQRHSLPCNFDQWRSTPSPSGLDRTKVRTLAENANTLGFIEKTIK